MPSSDVKYIGLDVHKEAIPIAVLNGAGKLVMESIVETKASTLLDFLHGLRGELHVTLEEGTWAAWLYDVLKPHVREVVVCNPRRNALLKEGSKNDKVDARRLAELLRSGMLRAVYHGENGLRTLRELARSYEVVSKDTKRVLRARTNLSSAPLHWGWHLGLFASHLPELSPWVYPIQYESLVRCPLLVTSSVLYHPRRCLPNARRHHPRVCTSLHSVSGSGQFGRS